MKVPEHHFYVCNSFRLTGEPQGFCNKKGAKSLMQYLEEECGSRGIDAMVTSTGCLKVCERGPVMIVQPENIWYGKVTEEVIDSILEGIENGALPEENRMVS